MNVVKRLLIEVGSAYEQKVNSIYPALKKYFEGKIFKYTYEELNAKRRPYTKYDYSVYYTIKEVWLDYEGFLRFTWCFVTPEGRELSSERSAANYYERVLWGLYKKKAIKEYYRFGISRKVREMLQHRLKTYFNFDMNFLENCTFSKIGGRD